MVMDEDVTSLCLWYAFEIRAGSEVKWNSSGLKILSSFLTYSSHLCEPAAASFIKPGAFFQFIELLKHKAVNTLTSGSVEIHKLCTSRLL